MRENHAYLWGASHRRPTANPERRARKTEHPTLNIQHPTSNEQKPGKATQSHSLAKAEMLKAES
jgi:hypothetical protein